MDENRATYQMKDYGRQSTFASFLPGIAGVKGIPIWCYYVNRGQGVVSFGVDNKDHAIMEYYPAHVAYQNVKRMGFRTLIRKDGKVFEAFSREEKAPTMTIAMNHLQIQEIDPEHEIQTEITYFTLPEERMGALVRKVEITNTAAQRVELEIIDGMPAVIPYGVGIDSMKNMTQTAKAWMQVEMEEQVAFYRVRASMDDSAKVSEIAGGNFAYAISDEGERLAMITDPEVLFGYDLSLERPVNFVAGGIERLDEIEEKHSNLVPCAFFVKKVALESGERTTIYEIIGQVETREILETFLEKGTEASFFEKKYRRNEELTEELTACIETKTANPVFDAYCRYTYMDNVLRGGYPIRLGHNKIFYVYSRKHGDLERDYNYYSMLPEFYSQGNGNFRDVNQNRRMDTFFAPFVGRENIHTFYSLIQLDGYNPLGIEKLTYVVGEQDAQVILSDQAQDIERNIRAVVTQPFTPGRLYETLVSSVEAARVEELFGSLMDFAKQQVNGNFGEGYWCDHWDYNLDLIEEYLSIYPEAEEEMLYEPGYSYFLSQVNVNPRTRRYVKTPQGIRQYHALKEESKRSTKEKLVRAEFGKGEVIYVTLLEKLILLAATKFAALDPYGMGIEMEGGKPGWYDALNGLPGLFGSSMAETYELARHLNYTIGALHRCPGRVALLVELGNFMDELELIARLELEQLETEQQVLSFWNKINDVKEIYRDKTYQGVSGKTVVYDSQRLCEMLERWLHIVELGIEKAQRYGRGICPTYFTYEVKRFEEHGEEIIPQEFCVQFLPYFLEGPARYLKLGYPVEEKRALYEQIKASDLYDEALKMYKVNASLANASYELGRCRAFTPGWLENESIWLHMEYKYLLELLKSGLYQEFAEDFHHALIPFLDEKTYGRSVLENSSFIASSSNPDPKIHGKGFVARLSGSTVEFLNMYKLMMCGRKLFQKKHGTLIFTLNPTIPQYLIGEDRRVETRILGQTKVVYEFADRRDYFPGTYTIEAMELIYCNRNRAQIKGACVTDTMAREIREGRVREIRVKVS